jgi:OOP family OmpA-OmpF porin
MRRFGLICFAFVCSFVLFLAAQLARDCERIAWGAPEKAPFNLQLARPAMDSQGLYTVEASQILPRWDVSFGLVLTYLNQPLSLAGNGDSLHVEHLMAGRLQGAVGLPASLELGFGLPFVMLSGERVTAAINEPTQLDAQGLSDVELSLKWRILDTSRNPVGLAAIVSGSFPIGDPESFLGAGLPVVSARLVTDALLARRRLHLLANLGARFEIGSHKLLQNDPRCDGLDCSTSATPQLEGSHHLLWGIGLGWQVVRSRLITFVELRGQVGLKNPLSTSHLQSASEAAVGAKLYLASRSYLLLGVGRGLHFKSKNHQLGSPAIRAFAGFVFEPTVGDKDGDGIADDIDGCPTVAEDFDDFQDEDGCPDKDNDKDGILDVDDKCPMQPEDKDGHDDHDGCPDDDVTDRDGDGIPDPKDRCPDDPEDKDNFEDKDGCPDKDNDKDGILDIDDLCPNQPEDKDGFEDKDGCPDPDNDKDGILDVDDKCPMEPETKNGYQDQDGCPDSVVRRGKHKLFVLEKIHFETNSAVIRTISFPVLDAVAASMLTHRDISLLEVQGHADERGSAAYNVRLTRARAKAVRNYLVRKGVARKRLRARGYGEQRPIDKAHTPAAWSKNRRVEFVIIRKTP